MKFLAFEQLKNVKIREIGSTLLPDFPDSCNEFIKAGTDIWSALIGAKNMLEMHKIFYL